MTDYSPKEYWAGVGKAFVPRTLPASHRYRSGAPPWYNRRIDALQFRAMCRALVLARIQQGAHFLDVGCGTGRWLRRYQQFGFRAMGLDATLGMLLTARERGTAVPLVAGEAGRLPFPDSSFDAVSDVTVVQHIPLEFQPPALSEMLRVLKPGGRLILIEVIKGRSEHVFSREPHDWIQQVGLHGGILLGWFGQVYFFWIGCSRSSPKNCGARPRAAALSALCQVYDCCAAFLWPTRLLGRSPSHCGSLRLGRSALRKIFPSRCATHGVFVFRK